MDKHTPVSPEMKNSFSDEEMVSEEEVDEIIDLDTRYDSADSMSVNEDDSDNQMEDSSQKDDAVYVFRGHSLSKKPLQSSNEINYSSHYTNVVKLNISSFGVLLLVE